MRADLRFGDCLEVMRGMDANSVDSVVCDPPYGLSFMGKHWDYDIPGVDVWREVLRVLKPGGHLLAFAGSRTYHRMVVAIEDAGFEIRDQIMWVYGSGFPKSLDVSKAIDKAAGAVREMVRTPMGSTGNKYAKGLGDPRPWMENAAENGYHEHAGDNPATDDARRWSGWGTALKPAHEPIVVARKPLIGTVAENVLTHGTGALNIDGCRVPIDPQVDASQLRTMNVSQHDGADGWGMNTTGPNPGATVLSTAGRWPANLIHDGSDEVLAAFPVDPGQIAKAAEGGGRRKGKNVFGTMTRGSEPFEPRIDSGSAARFFYCAKASRKDRNEGLDGFDKKPLNWSSGTKNPSSFQAEGTDRSAQNNHPTVKPTALMRYLCRLVTPPGGVILDPFMGSGSTGKAAIAEDFRFIGIERDADYFVIAAARIAHAEASC